jgi:hypothetical protein
MRPRPSCPPLVLERAEELDEVAALRHCGVGSCSASASATGGPPTGGQFATNFRCGSGSGSGANVVWRQGERVGPTDRGGGEVPSIEGVERGF